MENFTQFQSDDNDNYDDNDENLRKPNTNCFALEGIRRKQDTRATFPQWVNMIAKKNRNQSTESLAAVAHPKLLRDQMEACQAGKDPDTFPKRSRLRSQ